MGLAGVGCLCDAVCVYGIFDNGRMGWWCVCICVCVCVCVSVMGGGMGCGVKIIGVGGCFGLCVGKFAHVCLCCASVS